MLLNLDRIEIIMVVELLLIREDIPAKMLSTRIFARAEFSQEKMSFVLSLLSGTETPKGIPQNTILKWIIS